MQEPFELLNPKYDDWIKVEWKIYKRTNEIVTQYAKYTKYDESQIADFLLAQIIKDQNFVKWLSSRRYQKRINAVIFGGSDPKLEGVAKEVSGDDSAEKDCPF